MIQGTIQKVYVHKGHVLVDVIADRTQSPYRKKKVVMPMSGYFRVPQPGWKVTLDKPENGGDWIVTHVLSTDEGLPDEAEPRDVVIQFDENSTLKVQKQDNGTYNLSLDMTGEVTINAQGDVKVDGIDFDAHVHEHDDSTINDTSDGSGTESTTTKSTGPPQNP